MQSPCTSTASLPVASGNASASAWLFERERPPVAAKAHGQRQRIAGLGQVVADDAVEHGERDLAAARDRRVVRPGPTSAAPAPIPLPVSRNAPPTPR